MSLNSQVRALLNAFANSQPALNLPGQPNTTSNIMLGDLLAAAGSAPGSTYTPATPSNWASTAPANLQSAVDRMAALLHTLNSGAIP